jgi:hypothetical protein
MVVFGWAATPFHTAPGAFHVRLEDHVSGCGMRELHQIGFHLAIGKCVVGSFTGRIGTEKKIYRKRARRHNRALIP